MKITYLGILWVKNLHSTLNQNRIGILGLAERTVVASERAEEIAFLDIQVVAQDRAAVAQVGAQVKEVP